MQHRHFLKQLNQLKGYFLITDLTELTIQQKKKPAYGYTQACQTRFEHPGPFYLLKNYVKKSTR